MDLATHPLSQNALRQMRREQEEAYRLREIIRPFDEKAQNIREKAQQFTKTINPLPSQINFSKNRN
jgi:hypothetical protein